MVKPNFHAAGTKNDFHRSNQPPHRTVYLSRRSVQSIDSTLGRPCFSLLTLATRKYSSDCETRRPACFISYHLRGSWPLKDRGDRRGARYPVETFYQGRGRASPFIFWPFDESDMPDIPRWNTRVTRDGIEYLASKLESLLECSMLTSRFTLEFKRLWIFRDFHSYNFSLIIMKYHSEMKRDKSRFRWHIYNIIVFMSVRSFLLWILQREEGEDHWFSIFECHLSRFPILQTSNYS